METTLINDYKFVMRFNPLAAEIYQDKKYYYLSYNDMAEIRGLSIYETKKLFFIAKGILKDRDKAWMLGLSNRAKLALTKNKIINKAQLYNKVMKENSDLEEFKGIGHKVALEIHGWLLSKVNV